MRARRLRSAIPAALLLAAFGGAGTAEAITPEQARVSLNAWRAQVGLAAVTSTVPAWSTGCQHHDNYMSHHGLRHDENPADPEYTSDGAAAGSQSVLAQGFGDPTPRGIWNESIFHRVPLLDPRLRNIGFDQSLGFACLWSQKFDGTAPFALDNSPAARTPSLKLYPSPANGEQNVPTAFTAFESPGPHTEDGVQPSDHLGWLLSVGVNGPWADANFGYKVNTSVSQSTLAPASGGTAVPLAKRQFGTPKTTLGIYMHEGFGLFPRQILQTGRTYRVKVSGTVHTPSGDLAFTNFTWTFRTAGPNHDPPPCVVPRLKGKTLSQSKRSLRHAHCALGRVTKPKARRGHRLRTLVVSSQSPRAHSVRRAGTKVALRLREKPKRR
jgi:hypothetical protein